MRAWSAAPVPMLFALPPRDGPLLVAAGLLLGRLPDLARRRLRLRAVPVIVFNASQSLGPAAVLAFSGHLGIPAREQAIATMRVAFLVDAALAPVGLAVAVAAGGR